MDFSKFQMLNYLLASFLVCSTWAQSNELQAVHDVSSSLNQFAVNLLTETAEAAGDSLNLAISPYTVWSLLSIIDEGAQDNTARQLEDVLKIPPNTNKDTFRRSYKSLMKYLLESAESVQLDLASAIFTTTDHSLNRSYQSLTKSFYGVDVIPTDFNNLVQAANSINSYIAGATRNRISNFIKIDDLINAQILMASTLFFKGQWKMPFNNTATLPDTFVDESGNSKGKVMMMYQIGPYPYTILKNLKAHALELPYGKGDRFSMIVLLPRKGEPLIQMLRQLATMPFFNILDDLAQAEAQFGEEDVQVYLPRFTINSDLNMNGILDHMGIKDIFNEDKANLLGIFPHYLYVSRIIQQAKIEVNEEGTVASAAAGATFAYKSPPPKFYANRDFAYFIIEKPTQSIIFAGKVSNPNTICDTCSRKNN